MKEPINVESMEEFLAFFRQAINSLHKNSGIAIDSVYVESERVDVMVRGIQPRAFGRINVKCVEDRRG